MKEKSFCETISKERLVGNAWLIRLGDEAHHRRFSVTVDHGSSLFRGAEEGDAVLIAGGDPLAGVSFARIYRIRAKLDETTFFFDGVLPVHDGERSLTDIGMVDPKSIGEFFNGYANGR